MSALFALLGLAFAIASAVYHLSGDANSGWMFLGLSMLASLRADSIAAREQSK